jgi:hypothetical protein
MFGQIWQRILNLWQLLQRHFRRQLLAGESLSRNPADDSSVGNENIVTPLLARER